MCQSICYLQERRILITTFSEAHAKMPIKLKDNSIKIYPWGRRPKEYGVLPLGGWITRESLKQGHWDQYFPRSVKVPIQKFLEIDMTGQESWFDVTAGQYLQGVCLKDNEEQRIYIVTTIPTIKNNVYLRWPMIMVG